MSATADQIAELRRMTAESTDAVYSDAQLTVFIERYPLLDSLGRDPFQVSVTTQPPVLEANPDWVETWDLHRAAADVWTEKAGNLTTKFDFSTDAQSFSRSQLYQQAMGQARWHRARRSARTTRLWAYPRLNPTLDQVANGPEAW